ncbi:hypothetical protein BDR06DRAFT_1061732 [Suillus hirtellus]|nr:hypothetical protein BDR06DRAFT_1061732 [Suillus hirtellus]
MSQQLNSALGKLTMKEIIAAVGDNNLRKIRDHAGKQGLTMAVMHPHLANAALVICQNGTTMSMHVTRRNSRGQEIYPYYCVVLEKHIITWLETVDGYLLFQECMAAWHWNHKKLELEAQFWKHVGYFPLEITISPKEVKALEVQLNWYCVEALALEKSTAALLFWNMDQMKEMASELAIADEIKLNNQEGHHKYLNHHGQPEACLIQTHSLGKRNRNIENSGVITGTAITMFWIPIMTSGDSQRILMHGLKPKQLWSGFTTRYKGVVFHLIAKKNGQSCNPYIFTIKFGLDRPAKIGCKLALIIRASLTIPSVITSFGPGLI